jgi:hypothetical protein
MGYKTSKYGNIIKVESNVVTLIPMDESSSLYQEYLQFLQAGGTVEPSDLFTEEEQIEFNTPQEVALWKIRFVLGQMELEDAVTTAISQLPEPQKSLATYIWNYGNSIDRHSNTIQFVQSVLGLSEMQVNNIYIQANALTL